MYWQMFEPTAESPLCHRLHLLVDREDKGYRGIGNSYGYVEQTQTRGVLGSRKDNTKFTVRINATQQLIDVPDLETGMAVLMMNVKGSSDG